MFPHDVFRDQVSEWFHRGEIETTSIGYGSFLEAIRFRRFSLGCRVLLPDGWVACRWDESLHRVTYQISAPNLAVVSAHSRLGSVIKLSTQTSVVSTSRDPPVNETEHLSHTTMLRDLGRAVHTQRSIRQRVSTVPSIQFTVIVKYVTLYHTT